MLINNYVPYQVYLAWNQTYYRLFFSHRPEFDLEILKRDQGLERLALLTPPLPIGLAYYVLQSISTREERVGVSLTEAPGVRPFQERVRGWEYLRRLWQVLLEWIQGGSGSAKGGVGEVVEPPVNTGSQVLDYLLLQRWQHAHKALQRLAPEARPVAFKESGFKLRILKASGWLEDREVRETKQREASDEDQPLGTLLAGRALLPREIRAFLAENASRLPEPLSNWFLTQEEESVASKWIPEKVQNFYQAQALQGKSHLLPAVGRDKSGCLVCNRCGQAGRITFTVCPLCGRSGCGCCEDCRTMGLSRECMPFYTLPGVSLTPAPVPNVVPAVKLHFSLTDAQQQAAVAVKQFVEDSPLSECLVWAVCGAGKTEVTFSALAGALSRGARVLYAIPRREVVRELAPRIQEAFSGYRVLALYGGSEQRFGEADIYVSTTHQTLRFYHQFELVILDEVDAYPYAESPMLHYAVQRARKPGGKIIYLTATPEESRQKQALEGKMGLIYIPARYHGYPVPEPELVEDRQLRYPKGDQRWTLPSSVIQLLYQTVAVDQVQLFIFVPSVQLAERVASLVNRATQEAPFNLVEPWWGAESASGSKRWAEFCHAKDPQRDWKRGEFARGRFPVLVTTTILERGITISQVNVMVLLADAEKIFDAGTLIQMAGRAGRTEVYPWGKVWLVGTRITPAMRSALAQIQRMNQVARAQGFIGGEA